MRQDYEKLFTKLETVEPPPGLLEKITGRIERDRNLSIRRRIIIFATSTLCSAAAFILALGMFRDGLAESGFTYFFSLLFSDFGIVVSYWKSFSMSLLETLPILSLTLLSAILLVFLESLKLLAKNIKIIFSSKKLINT